MNPRVSTRDRQVFIAGRLRSRMNKHSIRELVAALRSQYQKVRALAAFAELKRSELRPGNEFAVWGFLRAHDEYALEAAILSGHADMLEAIAAAQQCRLTRGTMQLMADIRLLTRQPAPSRRQCGK
jgi:hypothetical protein